MLFALFMLFASKFGIKRQFGHKGTKNNGNRKMENGKLHPKTRFFAVFSIKFTRALAYMDFFL